MANSTGQVLKVDDEVLNIEQMLGDTLAEKLRRHEFLSSAAARRKLVVHGVGLEAFGFTAQHAARPRRLAGPDIALADLWR